MRIAAASWVLGVMALVSACSILPRPTSPPVALHDFGGHAQPPESPARWSTVTVEAPEWLKDERIRYRLVYDVPTRVRFYGRDRWLAAPPSLLAQRLSLISGGGRYRLKIELLEFEQVFAQPNHARVILSFRATAGLPEADLQAERVFKFARATSSADAIGAVSAFAGLVDEARLALTAWLAELPEHGAGPEPEKK